MKAHHALFAATVLVALIPAQSFAETKSYKHVSRHSCRNIYYKIVEQPKKDRVEMLPWPKPDAVPYQYGHAGAGAANY